jgi:hypothetical protein
VVGDIEHLFMFISHFCIFFREMSILCFTCLKNLLLLFWSCRVYIYIYISLVRYMLTSVFSHFVGCLFTTLIVSIDAQKFFFSLTYLLLLFVIWYQVKYIIASLPKSSYVPNGLTDEFYQIVKKEIAPILCKLSQKEDEAAIIIQTLKKVFKVDTLAKSHKMECSNS